MTMKSIVLASMGLLILAAPAWAVAPVVRLIQPVGGQRGTEVAVTLSGQRLNDIQEILFYQPGIAVTKIVGGKEPQAVVTFKISETAALGLHDFRVRTATGVSSLKTFSVGASKEVAEVEPNSDFARPQPIDMNVTVNGVAGNEDIDYYRIRATKGERITVEVEGIRLGLTLFDPYVAILDAKRFELASSDDSALIWQDGLVSLVAPEDGTYVIAVREAAYAGNAQCLYRLHVGHFPRPTATLPAGGKFGDHVKVRWIGDVMGETTTEVDLPGHADRTFGLLAHDATGTAPYPNTFRLSPFGNTIESEPNQTHDTATPFTPPIALNGVIEKPGDVDLYAFKAMKGQRFDVRVLARGIRSPLDPVLNIFGKNAGRVAGNDDSGGPDSYVRFTAPRDGDFVISVTDHLKNGGPDYAYRVEISPVTPRLELSTPNESLRRGTSVMAAAVPRGNRQAILIQARREDFSGAISLTADGLPPGVTVEADEMTRGQLGHPGPLPRRYQGPDRRLAGECQREADRHLEAGPLRVQLDRRAGARPEQRPVLDAHRRVAGRRGDGGGAVHGRDRRAQSAHRARWLDGIEGGRQAQAGLHRPDRDRVTLESAGDLVQERERDPGESKRGDDPDQRVGRRGVEDVADRGQRHLHRATARTAGQRDAGATKASPRGPTRGVVRVRQADGRTAVLDAEVRARPASSRGKRSICASR